MGKTAKIKKSIKASRRMHPLAKIARDSSAQAIRESKALGLDIVYMENGKLYCEKPDGSRTEIVEKKKLEKKK